MQLYPLKHFRKIFTVLKYPTWPAGQPDRKHNEFAMSMNKHGRSQINRWPCWMLWKSKNTWKKSVTVRVYTRLVQVPGLWWCVFFPLLGGSECLTFLWSYRQWSHLKHFTCVDKWHPSRTTAKRTPRFYKMHDSGTEGTHDSVFVFLTSFYKYRNLWYVTCILFTSSVQHRCHRRFCLHWVRVIYQIADPRFISS